MTRYHVFDPYTGVTFYAVPFAWMARLLVRRFPLLDWNLASESWL